MSEEQENLTNDQISVLLLDSGMPEYFIHILRVSTKKINDSLPVDARMDEDYTMLMVSVGETEPDDPLDFPGWVVESSEVDVVHVAPHSSSEVTLLGVMAEKAEWHQGPGDMSPEGPMRTAYAQWRKSVSGGDMPSTIGLAEVMQRDFLTATIQNATEYALAWEPGGDLFVFARGLPLCNERDIVLTLRRGTIDDNAERRHVESALH